MTKVTIGEETYLLNDWVLWIAQDADGIWRGYEKQPHRARVRWRERRNSTGSTSVITRREPNPNWHHTAQYIGPEGS